MSVNEWELCKENVEPIKQGRKIQKLNDALVEGNKKDSEFLLKRNEIKIEFECQIDKYVGNDPLAVWIKYVDWIEQSYPEGGFESNLGKVLENCIQKCFTDTKYKEDKRFLSIFLKYIKLTIDPLEVFNFIFDNKLFSTHADFFINWSWYLENCMNVKKADEVLDIGLKMKAQPNDVLVNAKSSLEMRVAKAVLAGDAEELNVNTEQQEDDQRKKLGDLKPKVLKNGKAKAPITRVGKNTKSVQGGLKTTAKNEKPNQAQVKIYNDENDKSPVEKEIVIPETKVPTAGQPKKENVVKVSKWCDEKVKQKAIPAASGNVPIYKDCEKSPVIAKFEKLSSKQQFFFNERKLYKGNQELSFEEIRGKKWQQLKEKEEQKKKTDRLEQELIELKAQIASLLTEKREKSNDETSRGAVSMIRELCWAGTLEPHSDEDKKDANFSIFVDPTTQINYDQTKANTYKNGNETAKKARFFGGKPKNNIAMKSNWNSVNENQSGFKSVANLEESSVEPYNTQANTECFTIALPRSEDDFIVRSSSTPATGLLKQPIRKVKDSDSNNQPASTSANPTQDPKLSPITENSREYKSSSCSSSSSSSAHLKKSYRSLSRNSNF